MLAVWEHSLVSFYTPFFLFLIFLCIFDPFACLTYRVSVIIVYPDLSFTTFEKEGGCFRRLFVNESLGIQSHLTPSYVQLVK